MVAVVSGCSSLLPTGAAQTMTEWETFEQARDTINSLEPYKTRIEEVNAKGIDPYKNPGISLLSFSDILQRFASSSAMRQEDFDPGIRDCLRAGKRCTGYSIVASRIRKVRLGNFWLDSLNFHREVDTTGWRFNALVILIDGLVVYTLYSGQPNVREREIIRNPLGPLQTWGEQAPRLVQ